MATLQDLSKSVALVEVVHPIDLDSAAQTGDYIHMKNYDAVLIVNYQGTEGAAVTVTCEQCTQDADGGGDVKAFDTAKSITATANTITTVLIEGAEFDTANNFAWIKTTVNDPGAASVGCVFALCYRARYAEATMPSAIT